MPSEVSRNPGCRQRWLQLSAKAPGQYGCFPFLVKRPTARPSNQSPVSGHGDCNFQSVHPAEYDHLLCRSNNADIPTISAILTIIQIGGMSS